MCACIQVTVIVKSRRRAAGERCWGGLWWLESETVEGAGDGVVAFGRAEGLAQFNYTPLAHLVFS